MVSVKNSFKTLIQNETQKERSRITSSFLNSHGAPPGFRTSINDAVRSNFWGSEVVSNIPQEYVPTDLMEKTMNRLKKNISEVMRKGETGHWCKVLITERVVRYVVWRCVMDDQRSNVTFKDVISFIWEERQKLDNQAIADRILSLSEILNLSSMNIIIGDKASNYTKEVRENHTFVQVHLFPDDVSPEFKERVRVARAGGAKLSNEDDGGVNVVLSCMFPLNIGVKETYKRVKERPEWEHPDVKGFSSSKEFCICFEDGYNTPDNGFAVPVEELIRNRHFSDTDRLLDYRGEVGESMYVRGSRMKHVFHFAALPSKTKHIKYGLSDDVNVTATCSDCKESVSSFWSKRVFGNQDYKIMCRHIYKGRKRDLDPIINDHIFVHSNSPGMYKCEKCIDKIRFVPTNGRCTECGVTGDEIMLAYMHGFRINGEVCTGTCNACMYKLQNPGRDLKRVKIMEDIVHMVKVKKAKHVANMVRISDPDITFDKEHASIRLKKAGFGSSWALGSGK